MIQAMLPEVAGRLGLAAEPGPQALGVIAEGLDQARRALAWGSPMTREVITDLSRHAAEALAAALSDHRVPGYGEPDVFQMQDWLIMRCDAVTGQADKIAARTVGVLAGELAAGRAEDLSDHARGEIETLVAEAGDPYLLACAVAGLAAGLLMYATGDLRSAKAAAHALAAPRLGGGLGGPVPRFAGIDASRG